MLFCPQEYYTLGSYYNTLIKAMKTSLQPFFSSPNFLLENHLPSNHRIHPVISIYSSQKLLIVPRPLNCIKSYPAYGSGVLILNQVHTTERGES